MITVENTLIKKKLLIMFTLIFYNLKISFLKDLISNKCWTIKMQIKEDWVEIKDEDWIEEIEERNKTNSSKHKVIKDKIIEGLIEGEIKRIRMKWNLVIAVILVEWAVILQTVRTLDWIQMMMVLILMSTLSKTVMMISI